MYLLVSKLQLIIGRRFAKQRFIVDVLRKGRHAPKGACQSQYHGGVIATLSSVNVL